MLAGIREILIISTPQDLPRFRDIFSDGSSLGLNISYKEQLHPNGIAEAFIIGEKFTGDDNICLILGDNIFYGHGLTDLLRKVVDDVEKKGGATIFGYYVNDPERYGIVEFDDEGNVLSIEEKPPKARSKYAVTGLYFYSHEVIEIAKSLKPSWRNELEITDINKEYHIRDNLRVELMGRGYAWLDTGTYDSLLDASEFIATMEKRQGLKVACIEEIAYKLGYIDKEQLMKLAEALKNNGYGKYLMNLVE